MASMRRRALPPAGRRFGGRVAQRAVSVAALLSSLVLLPAWTLAGPGLRRAGPRVCSAAGPAAALGAASAVELPPAAAAAADAAIAASRAAVRQELRLELLAAAAATCRGQCGSSGAREGALRLVETLEALNPTPAPASDADLLVGEWQLVFASEDVTRSSPFFWAWRQLLRGVADPFPLTRAAFGTEGLAESIFAVTDGIPIKSIGQATQSIRDGRLVNRVGLTVFGVGDTAMTTACTLLDPEEGDGDDLLRLAVETTQPAASSLPLADAVVFPSGTVLGDAARVVMRISYLDESLRIARNDADGQVFVYVRAP
mmetsp:Transcript_107075/g.302796  ORF Transcript_107075/g.302796 Transcript_107075/m.302796 type:complete len:315 (+) Transcript_107075:69-1013(+)